jgi:hypothetical protein
MRKRQRRGAACGDARTAAQRQRAAAQTRNGAGVHQMRRERYQDDEHARAKTTASSRGGGDGSTRRAAGGCGGGGPAKSSRRRGARASRKIAPGGSLPHGGPTEQLQGDRKAANRRRTAWLELDATAAALRRLGFRVRGPRGAAVAL